MALTFPPRTRAALALLGVLTLAPAPLAAEATPSPAARPAAQPAKAANKPAPAKKDAAKPVQPPPPSAQLRERLGRLVASRGDSALLTSIAHLIDVAERTAERFKEQSITWRARAARYVEAAERGEDPYRSAAGEIVSRGYRSPISTRVQGYTVYTPPGYDPKRTYPLMLVLHGGSSNGNLFLGVVLGNNMNWKEYDQHLWDTYQPRWYPEWIVAAPDGYGQVMWRYMGEQDVLDVLADIKKNYSVDPDRVVLSGLSNGGVGAYSIGSRHASEFSVVQAMAGAPSWRMYSGEGSVQPIEATLMRAISAIDLVENWHSTDFRYYHGTVDPGPMRPAYVRKLDEVVKAARVPARGKWFEAGHDLLYIAHRHGAIYDDFATVRRKQKPAEVHLVTGDYRARKQHWLEITRLERYPELGRAVARANGGKLELEVDNVRALAVSLAEAPLTGDNLEVTVNGARVYAGPRAKLGPRLELSAGSGFRVGPPEETGLVKKPGLSGPITDAYYERMVHVYGTGRPENTGELKKLAQKGAKGWPLWLWTVEQEVVADTAVTPELAKGAHLVLYGTPGDNRVLDRIMGKLPIQVEAGAVTLGGKRFDQKGVGTRFIYPNPEAPTRYVIVNAAPTLDGVRRSHNLPDFVPDYVVYDATSTAARPRLVPGKPPLARGFFDGRWQLPAGR
jgi:enterochelin esterase-like enzyme